MNDELKRITEKHTAQQRLDLSQPSVDDVLDILKRDFGKTPEEVQEFLGRKLPCPKCGAHGATTLCPFRTDEEIISALAASIVADFSTRDAKALVRLFCTEGPRIGLELHEALLGEEK